METKINKKRLFSAISLGLVVTALTFAIRANFIGILGKEFGLNSLELGQVVGAAFWGFTIAMFIGGPLCDFMGLKNMYILAFLGHTLGIILTIYSTGYLSLYISTLLIGLGNGFIESASYTLVSTIYSDNKVRMLSRWHIWFPAGIVIGGVISYFMSWMGFGWKVQMAMMIPPTVIYGMMLFNQNFPKSERIKLGISYNEMLKECLNPLFIFMVLCMCLTSSVELGTNQWIAELLSAVGVPSILLLVFINGIMTLGRANADFILSRFTVTKLLIFSALFSFLGLLWLGNSTGYTSFAAAGVFAIGICFFWPTMIGFVSENLPKTGPIGLSIMGGVGLLSTALIQPYFSAMYDYQISSAIPANLNLHSLQNADPNSILGTSWQHIRLAAGTDTLLFISILPAMLLVAFIGLHLYMRKKEKVVMQ